MKFGKLLISVILLIAIHFELCASSVFSYPLNGSLALNPSYMPTSLSSSISHIKGAIGEYFTRDYFASMKNEGWVPVNPRSGNKGLDHVYIKFKPDGGIDDLLIGETKFKQNSFKHGTTPFGYLYSENCYQMSGQWIRKRMHEYVIPQYTRYIDLENNGDVVMSQRKPQQSKIESGSIVSIDEKSFYFKRKGDSTVYFYDGNGKYATSSSRMNQVKKTADNLASYVDHDNYRPRVIKYYFDSNNVLMQEVYEVVEDFPGAKPKIELSDTFKPSAFKSEMAKASVANSPEFQQSILKRYGLADASFFDKIDEVDKKLRLLDEVDVDTGKLILSLEDNKKAMASRYGLNPLLDYDKINLTNSEMQKLFTKKSLKELPEDLAKKLKKASTLTTLKGTSISTGAGFLFSFASELAGANGDLSNIDWAMVGYSSAVMTAGSLLERSTQKLSFELIDNIPSKSVAIRFATKLSPAAFAIGIDTLTDMAFTGYSLFKGEYSLKQAAVVTGLNLATNAVIYFGSNLLSTAVTGAIGGSWGGPVGVAIGASVAVVLSASSVFIIDPITQKIELSDTVELLKSINRVETIQTWTDGYFDEAVTPY